MKVADALMRSILVKAALGTQYAETFGAVMFCVSLRNQYAHCHWGDYGDDLYFTNLQDPARDTEDFYYWYRHIDLALLKDQQGYFDYAANCIDFLQAELQLRRQKIKGHVFPWPLKRNQPRLHNPPEEHIPPWLNPSGKKLHLARTEAARSGAPTPSRAQQAQEARRAAKKAARAADRERGLKGSSRSET